MNFFLQKTRNNAFLATTLSALGLSIRDTLRSEHIENEKDLPSWDLASSFSSSASFLPLPHTNCEPYHSNKSTADQLQSSKPRTKLLFLGTGSSTGCPKPICAITFPESKEFQAQNSVNKLQKDLEARCKISRIANIGDPRLNKNYRNNPSLLISHRNDDDVLPVDNGKISNDDRLKNVIIDVGKTFREGALRWMPHHGIFHVDSIVLTHEHADAFFGLDDLRGFQLPNDISKQSSIPIYLSPQCFEVVKKTFGYLVPKKSTERKDDLKGEISTVKRHVASLDFRVVQYFKPFYASGLKMIPLPVIHGGEFICNGYAFSVKGEKKENTNIVYLSDISQMPAETERFILDKLPPTDILVVDSLLLTKNHPVHFSLDQALNLVKRLGAKKTYIVGINCDSFPEHNEANIVIRAMNPTVELAHDGLSIEL